MKSNAAALETALESRCSTSVPRLYYSYARTNILTTEELATSFESTGDNTGWSESGGGTLTYGDTDQRKYGDGAIKFVCSAQGDKVVCTIPAPSVATYQGKTLTFSVRVYCADAESVRVNVADNVATTNGAAGNTTAAAWRLYQVAHAVDAAATSLVCEVEYRGEATPTLWIDGAKLEEASTASNWSSRFFDVDDIKVGGTAINATEIAQARLRGKLEWGQTADNSAPAPLMAYGSHLKFTFEDDGTIISQWTKQGTGIHLRIGQTTSSAYADCTPAFHGIVWDWTRVAGTDYTYDVECYGLEKLWQEYDCGPDTVDGPRKWGILDDTSTTVGDKWTYATPGAYHLQRAVYDSMEVNRMNAVVTKWPADTTTYDQHLLQPMFPLASGKTLVASYFQGRNYTDWIDYVESLTAITNGMPTARTGHGGDTLTATDGPWAHAVEGTSAWDNLANAVGVKYYGYRYDENGQIVLKNLPGTRSVDATSRATSESDATKTGQIRAFERLDDVYRCNDPCVDFAKYGVDSETGSAFPVHTYGSAYAQAYMSAYDSAQIDMIGVVNASPMPFCFQQDAGLPTLQAFDDTLTVSSSPTVIDGIWRAFEAGGGAVTIAGDGKADIVCATTTDAAGIESIAAMGANTGGDPTSWMVQVKIVPQSTSKVCKVALKNAQGAGTTHEHIYKVWVVFMSDASIHFNYLATDGTSIYTWRSGTNDAAWTPFDTSVGTYTAGTTYWVSIWRASGSYGICLADEYGVPLWGSALAVVPTTDVHPGDDYLLIGEEYTNNFTCDCDVLEIRYFSPFCGWSQATNSSVRYGWAL